MVIKSPPPSVHENIYSEPDDALDDEENDSNEDDKPKPLPRCSCVRQVCPPRGKSASLLTIAVIILTLWAVCFCVLGEVAMPGNIYRVSNKNTFQTF